MSGERSAIIPLAVPDIRGNEWTYVKECIDSGWVSSAGPFVTRFEREFARAAGVREAVAVTNGTAALHVALILAGVGPDDEVLVSTLTFIAPVNAIRYVGAWPVLVDCEDDFAQMDVAKVERFLREDCVRRDGVLVNRRTGRRVSAIVPVHILGHPVDMEPLMALARDYGLEVVEDATESLGASYRGRRVGTFGKLSCFSFNGNKLITTGGGGMIATDDPELAERARYLTTQAKDDPVEYVHGAIGFNYRLTNLQAAFGVAQVERLDEILASKRQTAKHYTSELASLPSLLPMREADWAKSAWWLYTVRLSPRPARPTSRWLMHELQARGIQTRPLWRPAHLQAPHEGAPRTICETAESHYAVSLSLPCSSGISADELSRVTDALRELCA